MEFKNWLMRKFQEWEKTQPNGRSSYSAFARYLGVKVNTYTQWRAGNNLPSIETAKVLSKKLGPEVYQVLGYLSDQEGSSVVDVRSALSDALSKISSNIQKPQLILCTKIDISCLLSIAISYQTHQLVAIESFL